MFRDGESLLSGSSFHSFGKLNSGNRLTFDRLILIAARFAVKYYWSSGCSQYQNAGAKLDFIYPHMNFFFNGSDGYYPTYKNNVHIFCNNVAGNIMNVCVGWGGGQNPQLI